MAFGSKFQAKGGGKKGPRGHLLSHKNKAVKLRPQPQKTYTDATNDSSLQELGTEGQSLNSEDTNEEEEECAFNRKLVEEVKPLEGTTITVSGCADDKQNLLKIIEELGGSTSPGLSTAHTHLVTDAIGSSKYEGALANNIAIMTPAWLYALQTAWKNAEPIDRKALDDEHRMLPLYKLNICLTDFARGDHNDQFRTFLNEHGAIVSPRFTNRTDYLLVASPDSPHSQGNPAKKEEFKRRQKQHPTCRILWEKWANEVVKIGGVLKSQENLWKWSDGGSEPTADQLEEIVVKPDRGTLSRRDTGLESMDSRRDGDSSRSNNRSTEGDSIVTTSRRANGRIGNREIKDVGALLETFQKSAGKSYTGTLEESQPHLPTASTSKLSRSTAVGALTSTGFANIGASGKSVIKALTTSRATSFIAPSTKIKKSDSASDLSLGRAEWNDASVQDDSAYFEELELPEQPTENYPPIFKGMTFALIGLDDEATRMRQRIIERGGTAWIDEHEEDAQYVIVHHFDFPEEYRQSTDPRVVTTCWLELCLYRDEVAVPNDGVLIRPIPHKFPVPRFERVRVHFSGYADLQLVPEEAHAGRFVRKMGGSVSDPMDQKVTYLVHAGIDDPDIPVEGRKVAAARRWKIPIVGMGEIREMARVAAEEQEVAEAQEELARKTAKGKGRAIFSEVGNSVSTPVTFSATLTAMAPSPDFTDVLSECVIFITKQCEANRKNLGAAVDDMGGVVQSAYSSEVTHLVHASKKSNESFKEFKSARSDKAFIVHPAWIEQCARSKNRHNEADFPHTYHPSLGPQLAGLIFSPTRSNTSTVSRTTSLPSLPPISRANSKIATPSSHLEAPLATDHISIYRDSQQLEHHSPSPSKVFRVQANPGTRSPIKSPDVLARRHTEPEITTSSPLVSPPRRLNPSSDGSSEGGNSQAENVPLARDPQEILRQQTVALLASLDADKSAKVSGSKASRFGRNKSFTRLDTAQMPPPPPLDPVPYLNSAPFESQFTQFEEESMCVVYADPREQAVREKIQAALRTHPQKVVSPRKAGAKRTVEQVERIGDEGDALLVEESLLAEALPPAKRTRGSKF